MGLGGICGHVLDWGPEPPIGRGNVEGRAKRQPIVKCGGRSAVHCARAQMGLPFLTMFTSVTCFFPGTMSPLEVSLIVGLLPTNGVKSPRPQFGGEQAFSSRSCRQRVDYCLSFIGGSLFTFRVSRRRREMYSGHPRLCVCVCVFLSVCPRPHAYTIARTRK